MKSFHGTASGARKRRGGARRINLLESLEGRVLFDTMSPTAFLTATQPPMPGPGGTTYVFSITYTDDVAIRGASLGDDDVRVTGPNGFNQVAKYIPNAPPDAPMVQAMYTIDAPNGMFTPADNGSYTVSIEPFMTPVMNSGVTDTSFNSVAPGPIGEFSINLGEPMAMLEQPQPPATFGAPGFVFYVAYFDDTGINPETLDNLDLLLQAPDGFFRPATFVQIESSMSPPGGPAMTRALYSYAAPTGTLTAADAGTYTASMRTFDPAMGFGVADLQGVGVKGGIFGSFNVQFGSPPPPPPAGPDTTAPTGNVDPAQQPPPPFQAPAYVFTVNYTDNVAVRASTLGNDDVMVTGPNGFSQVAQYVGGNQPDGTFVRGAYRINAPGGTLDQADVGTYTVTALGTLAAVPNSGVRDLAGNPVAAGVLGTFNIMFGGPPPAGSGFGDLALTEVSFAAGQYAPGGQLFLRALVTNVGTAPTGAFRIAVGLSPNGIFEDGTFSLLQLADVQVLQPLSPGQAVPVRVPAALLPPNLQLGTYFLGVKIESNEDVDPTLAGNNLYTSPTAAITIAPVQTAPLPPPIGGLDPRFGTGGVVRQRTGLTSTTAVAVQADGKTVAVGPANSPDGSDFAITRFNTDGTLDLTFGAGTGTGYIDFEMNKDVPVSVRVLPDGKLLVAGTSSAGLNGSGGSDFVVARFNADGTPDVTFGMQGRARTNFGMGAPLPPGPPPPGTTPPPPSLDVAQDLILLPDGRFLVSGRSDAAGLGSDFALARYNADGSADVTFNGNGKVTTDFAGGDDQASAIDIDAKSGNILAAGSATLSTGKVAIAMARYRTDGRLDTTFGTGGLVTTNVNGIDDQAFAVALGAKGQITVAGAATDGGTGSDLAVVRYTSKGALDGTFGTNGIVTTSFGQPTAGNQMQLMEDGSVLVAGATAESFAAIDPTHLDVALALFNSKGVLDPIFDGDGKTILNLGTSVSSSSAAPVDPTTVLSLSGGLTVGGSIVFASSQAAEALAVLSQQRAIAEALSGRLIAVATNGEDTVSAQIVTSGADLTSTVVTKLAASVVGGAKGSATVTITDAGNLPATGTVNITLYASFDGSFDAGDMAITTITGKKVKLKVSGSKSYAAKFVIPTELEDGNYYILAKITPDSALTELTDENNTGASATPVAVAAPFIDVTGPAVTTPSGLSNGSKVVIPVTLTNEGNVLAKGAIDITIVAGVNSTLSAGDATLAMKKLSVSLKPGASKTFRIAGVIPADLAAGTYFLLISGTASGFTDVDETNNLLSGGEQLVI